MLRLRWLTFLLLFLGMAAPAGAMPQRAEVTPALSVSELQPGQQAVVAVVLDIAPGFHAQSHTPSQDYLIGLEVELEPHPAVEVLPPIYPPGKDTYYPALGELNVYSGRSIIYVPVQVDADAEPGPVALTGSILYQICDDQVCYMPEQPQFTIQTAIVPAGQAVTPQHEELFADFDPAVFAGVASSGAPPPPGATRLGLFGWEFGLAGDAYLLAFALAFVVGIIFNLMPCVLPVVPLKAIGFYEVAQHNRGKSLFLGIIFSLGLLACFAVLALLVVVFRTLTWGELFSSRIFAGSITAILVVMALGMFGVFTVLLPTGVYRWTPRHDTISGNFLFGIFAAILSTPCTAPMFVGLLAWAVTQPTVLGVAIVMMVGLGMTSPYLLLSAFPGLARRFPRSGPWSEMVKQMMGFLLLAVAAFFGGRFFMEGLNMLWLVTAVLVAGGIFLIVRTIQLSPRAVPIGVAAVVALLLSVSAVGATLRLTAGGVAWQAYSADVLADARATGRPVVVEFTADWCVNCIYLEATVLRDRRTVRAFERYGVVPIKVDLTERDAPGWALLRELTAAGGIPLTAIYAPGSIEPIQLSGMYTTRNLLDALDRAVSASAAIH